MSTGPDPKERFFWRIGARPTETKFPSLNAPPVIPKAFPQWAEVMETWGNKLLGSVQVVAEMLSVGLGFEQSTLKNMMKNAPHLLAPTGTNLDKYGALDTIIAGFHYDLSFLTIHGKSRFPGLFIWLRNEERKLVRMPDGCLLIQAGKQLEILTAGYIRAGYHEVSSAKETVAAVENARAKGMSTWRISSTLFSHIASDEELKPLGTYANSESAKDYPPVLAGDQVTAELRKIKLSTFKK
eukprot:TRINITY_DN19765_c0_g1_i1.p1 TRINITY_DN19765_c0_g1~~TRINITY_DN19765_c0_g1_i1.p1  ORF type:complete len:240 (+),score=49.24 TRINITY_DN19765_c0_g1_i1:353-1072(+)